MKNFLLKMWEDIEEIILHLIASTIVIIFAILNFYIIDFIVKIVFSEEKTLINWIELASQGAIFSLYLISVVRILLRALKKING